MKPGAFRLFLVNRLILDLLAGDSNNPSVATHLIEAAKLGPECFSDAAMHVLTDGFLTEGGETCLAVVSTIVKYRRNSQKIVPAYIIEAAIDVVKSGNDAACQYVADEFDEVADVSTIFSLLKSIISAPDYRLFRWRVPDQLYHERPRHSGIVNLLKKFIDKEPDVVLSLYQQQILTNHKGTRLNAAETSFDLLPTHSSFLLRLTPSLLRSLALADDMYEKSADFAVCNLLGSIQYLEHAV